MALKKIGVKFDHFRTCEWDINAIGSLKAVHFEEDNKDYSEGMSPDALRSTLYALGVSADGKKPVTEDYLKRKNEKWLRQVYNNIVATKNLVDITKVHGDDLIDYKTDDYCNILTYSFPCTDISLAGQQKGMERGSGTASSMLWEVERILSEMKDLGQLPEVLIMENVPAVHSTKNLPYFKEWLNILQELGYSNHWQDCNAKEIGYPEPVAQNRNRCFCVSILGDYNFQFPDTSELNKVMADYLEDDVDEKFYVNTEKASNLIQELIRDGKIPDPNDPNA